tara:strand:- start:523 stop:915 length:393 start_codon:yes stop_codon:yes gene_type:complete
MTNVLSEVRVYRPNKETNELEYYTTIPKEEVLRKFDETLEKSQGFSVQRQQEFKATGQKPNSEYKRGDVIERECHMCGEPYYVKNKRNTKFCSQKCGRAMANIYKKERACRERKKYNLLNFIKKQILRMK